MALFMRVFGAGSGASRIALRSSEATFAVGVLPARDPEGARSRWLPTTIFQRAVPRLRGMSNTEKNKELARRLADEVLSEGDLAVFDEIVADDYVNHNIPVPGIAGTKAGFRELVQETRRAFPDVRVHVDEVVAEGDTAVFHDHVTATSERDFFGVPANGKRLEWTEIHWLRITDGQIVEHWTNFDQLGILSQLGAVGP